MFSNKDIMEFLFPKWLRTIIIMIVGIVLGAFLFKSINTYSYLWGIMVGMVITNQYIE